ncbi:FAD-dependent oxidoreductase [Cellulomonas sp. ATA003]|uniref:FAD-dependent oxidoreductase n=1 Tax=Cellulomonas sp. ATA003 TaxID=3073064 RepID=UPI00287308DB|nr:FAD-dependent oxidoreductase [Cellulomonas sp. ATA003]WNB85895.1 FAD-dependent oxidoreductase [Cellulomonas sp. ATA003]
MTRVVVVGHGMVGSRFVEELARRDAGARVTVLGAEEYEPYNRVLLSEVVAGRVDVASLTLPRTSLPGVTVHPGAVATSVDRDARTVTTGAGDLVPYDALVLATGARARVPRLIGIDPDAGLPGGVHALRTLDDAREIVAATVNAGRAVVLGGGVLGLETACGLARRGLAVTVVHGGGHVMDRQLDAAAAQAVAHGLAGLGIEHRVDARAVGVDAGPDGRLRALVLADGERLPADLLVLTAGTVPEAGLAEAAGLPVRRGVLVDPDGATADPAIHAIGDCAEPPEGASGLIAQGWEQARRLAAHLADRATRPSGPAPDRPGVPSGAGGPGGAVGAGNPVGAVGPGSPGAPGTDVVRLKASGLEVVTMGVGAGRGEAPTGHRCVRLSDPGAGRHVEVVVADGVVVGATCVGAGSVAASLTAAYTRRTPTPRDPAYLLLGPLAGAGDAASDPSPTLMPDRTTICRCNGVTKGDLVGHWRAGARTVEEVAHASRATTGCGGCTDAVCGILEWLHRTDPPAGPDRDGAPPPADAPARPVLAAGAAAAGPH